MFNIYRASIDNNYRGECFIAAKTSEEAMKYIAEFKASDPNNEQDSKGIMSKITEDDLILDIKGLAEGILFYSVYYAGW